MTDLKLHIGAYNRVIAGWTNIDIVDGPSIDWVCPAHDLFKAADGCASAVYASHVLEYYSWEDARRVVLPEWRRVLKAFGKLYVAVPDFEAISRCYGAGMPLSWFIGPLYGRMRGSTGHIYHRCVYDEKTLTMFLKEAGFRKISRYDYRETEFATTDDHSKCYIPHMREDGILLSLNLQAER